MKKAEFDKFRAIFQDLVQKTYDVRFNGHRSRSQLLSVEKQPVTGFKLAPEKRLTEDGKNKVPDLVAFVFDDIRIVCVVEDMSYKVGFDFAEITIGDVVIEMKEVRV